MKRNRLALLVFLVAIFLLVPSAATIAAKTKIVFGYWNSTSPVWEQVAKEFNAQSDTIEVETIPMGVNWRALPEWLIPRLAVGSAPDIVFISPTNYRDMYEYGLLMDLKPYIDKDKSFRSDIFFPAVMKWLDQRGKTYAFPSGMVSMVNFYNKRLFADAGLPNMPMSYTQAQVFDWAKKLTKPNQKGLGLMWSLERVFHWVWVNGVDIFSADGTKPLFSSEEWVRTVDMLVEAQRAYEPIRPGLLAADFRENRLGMFIDGTWSYSAFSGALKDDLGVAPLPQGKAGYNVPLWPDSYAVTVGSKNPQAAWEVIRWFATEGARTLLFPPNGTLGIPVVRKVAEEFVRKAFTDQTTANTFMYNAQFGSIPNYPLNYVGILTEADAMLGKISRGEIAARVGLESLQRTAENLIGKMPSYQK